MSTSVNRNIAIERAHTPELCPEALEAVRTIHKMIRTWAPESDYTLTENGAEFPVLYGRCTVSVTPLAIDTYDGFRLSERLEARTELSYIIDDFQEPFFRLANTFATTGSVLRCPETGRAVIISGVSVFRDDADALRTFYVPTILWSALAQSFSVQQALLDTFGHDLRGDNAESIGMEGCSEPSCWKPADFEWTEELMRNNGIFCNASDIGMAAEFPWEPGAVSAIGGDRTSLLHFNSRVAHPTAGNGLAFRLILPVSADEADLSTLVDTLNQLESSGVDMPPAFGAWAYLPRLDAVAYTGFWLNCMYKRGVVAKIASWCSIRNRVARQVIANRN